MEQLNTEKIASKIQKLTKKLDLLKEKQIKLNEKVDKTYQDLQEKANKKSLKNIYVLEIQTHRLTKINKAIEELSKTILVLNNQNEINKLDANQKKGLFERLFNSIKFKRNKEVIYYSEYESNLLKEIYLGKIDKLNLKLDKLSKKYFELHEKISDLDKYYSLPEDVVEKRKEKIIKKIKKTTKEKKIEKLEQEYRKLLVNQFLPKFKLINNFKKKIYVNKLLKTSKRIDQIKTKIQHIQINLTRIEAKNLEKLSVYSRVKNIYSRLNYNQQKVVYGIIFILPWLIGFCIFFASPLFTTIWWSLNEMSIKEGGGFNYNFVGLGNYKNLFTNVTLSGITFPEMLTSSVIEILINLPVIIIFSLFIAVLLNKKFKGSELVKALFFIPVVFNMSVINNTLNGVFGQMLNSDLGEGFVLSGRFAEFLFRIGIGNGLVEFLTGAVDRIFTIVNMSGIQILIFIAGLKSIPAHLYEAAKVEGATKYEMFWKITIPMVSPIILTAIVYTVVDSFATSSIIQFMTVNSQGTTMATNQPGLYSAISIIYFLTNALIILIAFLLMKKVVFYYDD